MKAEHKEGWKALLEICQKTDSTRHLDELFSLFFTLEEKEALATRALLIKELLKGEKTQRQIAQSLNISIAKITRGSNALKITNQSLKEYLLKVFEA